jgi:hypothetical protein
MPTTARYRGFGRVEPRIAPRDWYRQRMGRIAQARAGFDVPEQRPAWYLQYRLARKA